MDMVHDDAPEPQLEQRYATACRILQRMPRGRARINPEVVGEVIAVVLAIRERWVSAAMCGTRGATQEERRQRKAYAANARLMLSACDTVLDALIETVSQDQVQAILDQWYSGCGAPLREVQ